MKISEVCPYGLRKNAWHCMGSAISEKIHVMALKSHSKCLGEKGDVISEVHIPSTNGNLKGHPYGLQTCREMAQRCDFNPEISKTNAQLTPFY